MATRSPFFSRSARARYVRSRLLSASTSAKVIERCSPTTASRRANCCPARDRSSASALVAIVCSASIAFRAVHVHLDSLSPPSSIHAQDDRGVACQHAAKPMHEAAPRGLHLALAAFLAQLPHSFHQQKNTEHAGM